tara:strand:- start:6262 stop:6789 length:528 start_codon:yes stop_codon:yes gene_type:complete
MKFNNELFFNSITQLIISIVIGTIVLYSSYKIIDKYIRSKHGIELNNSAYGILCASILFSVGYLISGVKDPIINSVELIQRNPDFSGSVFFEGLKYSGLFLAISVFVIWLINLLSIYLFTIMTKDVKEFEEIKNNNLAISLITAVIVISISLMVKPSLYLILESFVPYPDMPTIM